MSEFLDDAVLMTNIAGGDVDSFNALVDRYGHDVYAFAWRLCMKKTDAEDLAQEVFLKIWMNAGKWQPTAKLTTWLYKITYNQYVDMRRKCRPEISDDVLLELKDERATPEEEMLKEDTAYHVSKALAALPDSQREALTLCYYQGLTTVEAADVPGVTKGVMESLLFRARRTLKTTLGIEKSLDEGGEK